MTSPRWIVGIVTAVVSIQLSAAVFSPNITVKSCSKHQVVISLEHAAEGGLIYIQGRSSACQRTTQPELTNYEFNFDTCNIGYDTKFRVIIQKKPHYQTGNDKVIPVMCLVDTSDLFVTGVIYPEEVFDVSVNHTIRPSAKMRVFADTTDVSGGEVTLNDNIRMTLTLDDPFLDSFDIKAKDCMASVIPLIQQECSPDQELFPNFEQRSQGDLEATFQAFQPTNLAGYPEVDVAFTCSVAVCKDECRKAICSQTGGRKRRDADDDDDVVERVTVGTTLRVKSANMEAQALVGEVCAEKVIVTSVAVVTIILLVTSWCVCGCIISKFRLLRKGIHSGPPKQNKLRKMSEININMARAVGRRLSSMLNIPAAGYNMNKTGMMEALPEMDQTPPCKRRESVTVSIMHDSAVYPGDSPNACRRRNVYVDSYMQTNPTDIYIDQVSSNCTCDRNFRNSNEDQKVTKSTPNGKSEHIYSKRSKPFTGTHIPLKDGNIPSSGNDSRETNGISRYPSVPNLYEDMAICKGRSSVSPSPARSADNLATIGKAKNDTVTDISDGNSMWKMKQEDMSNPRSYIRNKPVFEYDIPRNNRKVNTPVTENDSVFTDEVNGSNRPSPELNANANVVKQLSSTSKFSPKLTLRSESIASSSSDSSDNLYAKIDEVQIRPERYENTGSAKYSSNIRGKTATSHSDALPGMQSEIAIEPKITRITVNNDKSPYNDEGNPDKTKANINPTSNKRSLGNGSHGNTGNGINRGMDEDIYEEIDIGAQEGNNKRSTMVTKVEFIDQ